MRELTDVRIRRGLLVLAAILLCLAVTGPVQAKEEKINFKPGVDISSWYWSRQVDQEVTTPPGVPPPLPTCVPAPPPVGTTCSAPPVSSRQRGPDPYARAPGTLPVSMYQGSHERKSAIKFDLAERGVIEGSKIKKLLLFIEESATNEQKPPQVRPETAKIQACRILDYLPQGENEQFEDAPKIDDKDCVEGTREVVPGSAAVWTFDLTKMADAWAKNPFENYGIMLLGVAQAAETWEVHLKVPRLDSATEEGDQYEMTKNRAFVTISFIPGEPPEIPDVPDVPDAPPAPSDTGTSSGFTSSGTPTIPASTDFVPDEVPPVEATPPPTAPTEQAGFFVPGEQGPRMPAYVWLGIPLALLALAAVRSVVLEPVGGPRPDGVISAIRRRNAQRRGGALVARQGVLGRMSSGLKRGLGGIGSGFAGLKRNVRRKS